MYIAFVVNFVAMIFLDKLGEPGYAIPGVIAAVLFVLGILNFKEVRNNIASPLILMMAGVIGVAGARLGFPALDAIASLVICALILRSGIEILLDALRVN